MSKNKLILLGTKGGPAITRDGSWPTSHALVIDGKCYVIDAGLGVTRQYVQAGLSFADLEAVFITHHHSDHNLELGALVYTAWNTAKPHEIAIRGPQGLDHLMRHVLASQAYDINIRIADEGLADPAQLITWQEYANGEVYQDDRIKVTSCKVSHPPVEECYALKIETANKTIIFGADTCFYPPLADFAKGADILIHEAMHIGAARQLCELNKEVEPNLWSHFSASHTSCEDAGRIATMSECKQLILNHFVPQIGPLVSRADFEEAVRTTYQGDLIIGHDLCEIVF
jgi:ribonuclease BN (tRNA processing enzyme)